VNRQTMFLGAIIAAVICIALGIYYAIPGIYHVLTFSTTHPPKDIQPTHVALFVILAIICVIAALVTRPKSNSNSNSNTSFR